MRIVVCRGHPICVFDDCLHCMLHSFGHLRLNPNSDTDCVGYWANGGGAFCWVMILAQVSVICLACSTVIPCCAANCSSYSEVKACPLHQGHHPAPHHGPVIVLPHHSTVKKARWVPRPGKDSDEAPPC
jgi:hypothetical protein